MRIPSLVFCIILSGCAASGPEMLDGQGLEYVGRKVDTLMAMWGPPTSFLKMNNGQTSYVWQLATGMSAELAKSGGGNTKTYACKVHVIASPSGTIQQIDTEDYRAGEGLLSFSGTSGNMCGERLALMSQR